MCHLHITCTQMCALRHVMGSKQVTQLRGLCGVLQGLKLAGTVASWREQAQERMRHAMQPKDAPIPPQTPPPDPQPTSQPPSRLDFYRVHKLTRLMTSPSAAQSFTRQRVWKSKLEHRRKCRPSFVCAMKTPFVHSTS